MSRVGEKCDGGPVTPSPGQLLALLQLVLRRPARVLLRPVVPSRRISTSRRSDSALTTETPTPCRPPGDLVAAAVAELAAGVQHGEHDLNRWATLFLVHRDGDPTSRCRPPSRSCLGGSQPRPRCQKPASASSTEFCPRARRRGGGAPITPVEPMYMPGRLRTASKPSSTVMFFLCGRGSF